MQPCSSCVWQAGISLRTRLSCIHLRLNPIVEKVSYDVSNAITHSKKVIWTVSRHSFSRVGFGFNRTETKGISCI